MGKQTPQPNSKVSSLATTRMSKKKYFFSKLAKMRCKYKKKMKNKKYRNVNIFASAIK